jgi:hypothetical protein
MPGVSTIQERAKAIRRATPDCLEELFEMQNRICSLCSQPIQDIVVCELDHGTPVIRFARAWDIAIEDAVRECNDPSNLRAVHALCNHVKHDMTRDEWFKAGMPERVGKPRVYTDVELLELQFRLGAGGRVSGRQNVESGRLARIGELPQSKEARRNNGRLGASKQAENGIGIFALGFDRSKAGGIGGRKHIESGHWDTVKPFGLHTRWHVKRGITNISCVLCWDQIARKKAA